VTDYSDAAFVHRGRIEVLNQEIRLKGGEKADILKRFKEAHSEMHRLEWETRHSGMSEEDLVGKIKELQLLRVTKNMQVQLTEGGDPQGQEEQKLQARMAAMTKMQKDRVAIKERQDRAIRAHAAGRLEENDLLVQRTASATALMEERRRMSEMRVSGEDAVVVKDTPEHRRQRSMRNMQTNRKLREIADSQMAEVRHLRDEVARLKQRSFPSFPVGVGQLAPRRVLTGLSPDFNNSGADIRIAASELPPI